MKPRPERTKTETKAEKRAETRMGPLRGVVRAVRIRCSVGELFYTLWPLFHLRFKRSAMILDPCQQTSPFGFKLSRFFRTESNFRRTEDQTNVMGMR
jgi:hypothetical protein